MLCRCTRGLEDRRPVGAEVGPRKISVEIYAWPSPTPGTFEYSGAHGTVRSDCLKGNGMALENKTAPSGIIYTDFLFRIIEQLGRARSVVWNDEPFVLKSKRLSHVYVNCRNDLTENPRLLHDLGYLIAWKARSLANDAGDRREVCLIGIPTAGTALALAGSLETQHLHH